MDASSVNNPSLLFIKLNLFFFHVTAILPFLHVKHITMAMAYLRLQTTGSLLKDFFLECLADDVLKAVWEWLVIKYRLKRCIIPGESLIPCIAVSWFLTLCSRSGAHVRALLMSKQGHTCFSMFVKLADICMLIKADNTKSHYLVPSPEDKQHSRLRVLLSERYEVSIKPAPLGCM